MVSSDRLNSSCTLRDYIDAQPGKVLDISKARRVAASLLLALEFFSTRIPYFAFANCGNLLVAGDGDFVVLPEVIESLFPVIGGAMRILRPDGGLAIRDMIDALSPEFLDDTSERSVQAQVWAFGGILHTMLYGEHPMFKPTSALATVYKIQGTQFTEAMFPTEPDAPNDAKDLILKCLQLKPGQRIPFCKIRHHEFFAGFDFKALEDAARASSAV